jgi:hypothetical protein
MLIASIGLAAANGHTDIRSFKRLCCPDHTVSLAFETVCLESAAPHRKTRRMFMSPALAAIGNMLRQLCSLVSIRGQSCLKRIVCSLVRMACALGRMTLTAGSLLFDFLQQTFCQLRSARTLEQALRQLLPADVVKEAKANVTRPCDMLGYLAEVKRCDPSVLLDEVALRLNLVPLRELLLPSAELIAESGHDAGLLASISVIPQPAPTAPAGWAMVVADPETAAITEYQAAGVHVYFGLAQDIDEVWNRRREATHGEMKIKALDPQDCAAVNEAS